jgi:hypothetical protein
LNRLAIDEAQAEATQAKYERDNEAKHVSIISSILTLTLAVHVFLLGIVSRESGTGPTRV